MKEFDWYLLKKSDVIMGAGVSEQVNSTVLNIVESIKDFGGCTIKITITVVESGCDDGMV